MTATVLITRPRAQAEDFAAALEMAHGGPVRCVISPLIEIVLAVVSGNFDDVAHVIFTSANGVIAAGDLNLPVGIIAWCVGRRTAQVARDAGFIVETSRGNSDDLVALIVAADPTGRMVHVRGRHVAGRLVDSLQEAGIECEVVVAYDQIACQPTQVAIDLLKGETPVIVPLFSPRTAKLLSQIGVITAPLHLILISDAVVVPDDIAPISSRTVVDHGKWNAMFNETLKRYNEISP